MQVNSEPGKGAQLSNEVRVGIMFLIGLILLLLLIMSLTHWGQDRNTYSYTIRFQRAEGLAEGAAVRVAGVDVGRVSSVSLDDRTNRAEVTIRIDKRVRLFREYKYTIGTNGLVGERFIEITPVLPVKGKPQKFVGPGKTLHGTTRPDFNDAMDQAAELMGYAKDLVKKATQTVEEVNEVVANDETQKNMKLAVANLQLASRNAAEMTQALNMLVVHNQAAVGAVVSNLQAVSGDIRRISDTIGPQIEHTTLFKNAELASKNAVVITDKLAEIANSLNGTICDKQLSADLQQAVKNLRQASADLTTVMADARTASASLPKVADNLTKASADLPEITTNLKTASADLPKITGPIREIAPDTAKNIHEISVRLRDASAAIGGIAQTASTLGGGLAGIHIAPEARVIGLSNADRNFRSDLNLDIRGPSTMLRAGVADLGGEAPLNLQFGNKLGKDAWLRYGVVQSQLGLGLDYNFGSGATFTGELFDPNDVRGNALLDLRLKALGPGWWITSGVWDLFGKNQFGAGLTYRP
ncbi:MAG TPA: MlaD family protein [Armatimonadota bacterium]